MSRPPTTLYIDTQVFYQSGHRFDQKEFTVIRDTFVKGGLRLLVPEMMERELLRHLENRAVASSKKLTQALNSHPIKELDLLNLPSTDELIKQCSEELVKQWEAFKSHFQVEPLPLVGSIEEVVDWYFSIQPPFADGKKSKEFPDAFILSVLDLYQSQNKGRIAVISGDKDFETACATRRYISYFEKLDDYIEAFNIEQTSAGPRVSFVNPTNAIIAEDLTDMKAILSRGNVVTPVEKELVMQLLSTRGTNFDFFFANAKDSIWIKPLQEAGYFKSPPSLVRLEDGKVRTPEWPQINYLVRVFDHAQDKVLKLLKQFPTTDNPRVLDGILQIIIEGDSPELIRDFYHQLESFIDNSPWGQPKLLALLKKPYFFNESNSELTSALLRKIVEFNADPQAEEKATRRKEEANDFYLRLEPKPKFRGHVYHLLLTDGVLPLAEKHPYLVAQILVLATASMIRLSKSPDELAKEADHDGMEVWCRRLGKLQKHDMQRPSALLAQAMVTACDYVYKDATESIESLDQILQNQRWNIFKRLRQQLFAEYPNDLNLPKIRELILIHEDYARWEHHYEFQLMLRKACLHFEDRLLTMKERQIIFDEILSGPSEIDYKVWMGENHTEAAWKNRKRHFHRKQLYPFRNILFSNYLSYYNQLEEELTDEPINNESYSPVSETQSGVISLKSPKTHDELLKVSDEDLLTLINDWDESGRASDDWQVKINIEALATAFQGVFQKSIAPNEDRREYWFSHREQISRPVYVKAIVKAMQAIINDGNYKQLDQWFSFCDWILDQPNEYTEEESWNGDEAKENPDWRSSRRAVCDMLGACLDKDAKTPTSEREKIANLLRKLCSQFDYRLDCNKPVILNRDDQVTEAINNTRSLALEKLIHFGFWLRRSDEAVDLPELREILDERFSTNAKHKLSLPEYAILGLNFGRIWNLDNAWTTACKDLLFPQVNLENWTAGFCAFIRYSNPSLVLFNVLKDNFTFALSRLDDIDGEDSKVGEFTDTLGEHLFTYYLWEVFSLEGDDSLLCKFYKKTQEQPQKWGHLFDHVGRIMNNTNELSTELMDRVFAFFDWRLAQKEPVELQNFTYWIQASCLGESWRLDAYSKILDITLTADYGISIEIEAINSLLANHPGKVVECFAKITDYLSDDEKHIYIEKDEVQPILEIGLNHEDPTINKDAERARENLLNARRFDFLD